MIILQVILWILFALVLLVGLVLCLKITVRLKYGEKNEVIIGIGFVRINLTKLKERREKRKKKPKVQRLSKTLPKEISMPNDNPEPLKQTSPVRAEADREVKTAVSKTDYTDTDKKENPSGEKSVSFEEKAKNGHGQTDGGIGKMLTSFVKGKSVRENLSLLKEILVRTSEKFSKHARLSVKKLRVTVSCPDAADTAVLFGIANGLVSSIAALAETFSVFDIDKGAVGVYQDYVSGKSSLEVDISFSMRVFGILLCTLPALSAVMKIKSTKSSQKENTK